MPDNVYSGSGVVGRTAEIIQQLDSPQTLDRLYGGEITAEQIKYKKWLGLYTRPTKGTVPLGALEDVKNFSFNKKTDAMVQRTGATEYATTFVDVSGTKTITTLNKVVHLSTESPSATNIDITFGQTSGAAKHIFQKPFFHASATATDSNLWIGEYLTGITIKGTPSGTSVVFEGGSSTTNYYRGWQLYNYTRASYIWVASSSKGGSDTTLILVENAPADYANTDVLTLYRHFHDNTSFCSSITYSTVSGRPPVALQQGNAVLLSGGMGTATGLKPIWTGYVNKTFFYGSTNYAAGINYQGTYATEAEIKNTSGITISTGTASSDATHLPDGRWFFCYVPETDDGQRGVPTYAGTAYIDTVSQKFSFTMTVYPGLLNKRLRYLNLFLGIAPNDADTTIDWNYLYYIERLDLLGSDWTWTKATSEGYFLATCTMDGDKWNNKASESLAQHLGHTLNTSSTCSFSVGKFINNRLFVAKYYDYVDAVEYLDQIRYTPFGSNGIGQLNKLANLDAQTQSTIEQGDATSVQKLLKWEDKLVILKDGSSYYIPVSGDTSQWPLITISNNIGCKNPDTAIETPFMLVWCQSGEDIYGWSGASPFSLAQNWLTTFQALDLTTALSTAWYDNKNKTYNFSYYSTLGGWYSMFFECPIVNGFKWGHNQFGGLAYDTVTYKIISASERAGVVYLAVEYMFNTTYKTIYFSTATTDAGIAISPYFKTAEFALSERDAMKIPKWYLSLSPTTGVGELDCKITIGSNTQQYSNISKTETLHSRGVLFPTCSGRKLQFEFNMDTYRVYYTALEVYSLEFDYELIPYVGDATITV